MERPQPAPSVPEILGCHRCWFCHHQIQGSASPESGISSPKMCSPRGENSGWRGADPGLGLSNPILGLPDLVLGLPDPVLGLPNPGLGLPPGIAAHPRFLMFTPAPLPSFPQGLVPRARCDPGAHPHPEHPKFWEVIRVPAWLFPFPHSRLEQGSVDAWNPRGLCRPRRSRDF